MKINQLWIGILIGVLTSIIANCILVLTSFAPAVAAAFLLISVTVLAFLIVFLKQT